MLKKTNWAFKCAPCLLNIGKVIMYSNAWKYFNMTNCGKCKIGVVCFKYSMLLEMIFKSMIHNYRACYSLFNFQWTIRLIAMFKINIFGDVMFN